MIEELCQIHIHHIRIPFFYVVSCRFHRIVCAASRSKSIAMGAECRFKDRTEYLMNCLLDHPIQDGRNSQVSDASTGFGYFYTFDGTRDVAPLIQFCTYTRPVLTQMVR